MGVEFYYSDPNRAKAEITARATTTPQVSVPPDNPVIATRPSDGYSRLPEATNGQFAPAPPPPLARQGRNVHLHEDNNHVEYTINGSKYDSNYSGAINLLNSEHLKEEIGTLASSPEFSSAADKFWKLDPNQQLKLLGTLDMERDKSLSSLQNIVNEFIPNAFTNGTHPSDGINTPEGKYESISTLNGSEFSSAYAKINNYSVSHPFRKHIMNSALDALAQRNNQNEIQKFDQLLKDFPFDPNSHPPLDRIIKFEHDILNLVGLNYDEVLRRA